MGDPFHIPGYDAWKLACPYDDPPEDDGMALLEAHAEDDPPTLDELEDYECPVTTTETYFAAPTNSATNERARAFTATGSAATTKRTANASARRLRSAFNASGAETTAPSGSTAARSAKAPSHDE